jgi:hypothetical protein
MAGEKTEPTTEEKVAALHDSVTDLHKKFDAFMSKHSKKDDDDDRKDARKDNEEDDEGEHDKDGEDKKDAKKDDDDDDKKDDRKDAKKDDKDLEKWAEEEKKEPEHKDAKKDADPDAAPEEKGEPKPMASDDDRRKDAKKDDDDDRARKDSTDIRRRLDRLERSRVRSDAELNALADAQQEWDRVAQQFGERAHRPLDGETLNTYNRRHVVRFQKHSPRWKDMDFSALPAQVMQVAMPDVRADAVEAAKRGLIGQPELREIVRYDRTGRKISEFIGDIAVTLAPFRLPSMRVKGGRINTRPNEY